MKIYLNVTYFQCNVLYFNPLDYYNGQDPNYVKKPLEAA